MKASVHKAQRVYFLWVEDEDNRRHPVFRGSTYSLLELPTDYCGAVLRMAASEHVSKPGVRTRKDHVTTAVRELYTYLSEKHLSIDEMNDKHILAFRDWCWERTKKRPQYRGDERVAKETTNIRLKCVYEFLAWAQGQGRIPSGTIGPVRCGVTSTLPLVGLSGPKSDDSELKKYPHIYKRTGRASRLGRAQYRATDDDISALEDYLESAGNPADQRQVMLIIRLIADTAWRIGSVASLQVHQFSRDALAKAEKRHAKAYDVAPPDQKFGYSNEFSLSWPIAYDIANYIEIDREEIIKRTGVSRNRLEGRIFLNPVSGRPFDDHALSARIAERFKEVGAGKGSGAYGVRRKAATRIAREEIEFRQKRGLSMQQEDVIDAIARRLGHTSKTAYQAYVEANAMMSGYSVAAEQRDQIEAVRNENAALRAKLAELERKKPPPKR
ncbi:hypothetical protein VOM14_16210 [Paraburkholderia sp. MPAMCS5]|uniref:hypothetical protein n=1 Tax=Paraburkholderia sp. MPAMCS5 TaxID=3112563 RepID=UPI002E187803|nr:hypothetical protein [Paraburkholderia sp. MPAMCS5]